ncbi:MAG: ABC transporter ATP-binding protein [Candidatus Njordarchaeales archaeon]
MNANEVLRVENLVVRYVTRLGEVRAVNNVSFSLKRGETLGLVGESGCGKSTLGLSLMRLLPKNGYIANGKIYLEGEDIVNMDEALLRAIRWKKISMIFQGAMNALNPVFPVGDQVAEVLMLHERVTREEAYEIVRELFLQVGLDPSRIKDYPHQLSGGMKQRVVIAMALALNPSVVIADEPTTALDVTIQAQILDLLSKLKRRYGLSMIYITHDLAVIAEIADRVAVMYAGYLVEVGDVFGVFKKPVHPYTKGLIASVPTIKRAKERRLISLPGAPPNLIFPPPGCPFAPRCPFAKDVCKESVPEPTEIDGHLVRCHFADELKDISPLEAWKVIMEG